MSLKEILKSNKFIRTMHSELNNFVFCMATLISPRLNTQMRYRQVFGKKLNLKKPQTLNEKILWLKLNNYIQNPLVIQCADKYRVRYYVEKCGYGDILNDLMGVYERAECIPWEELPNQFVLKWNFGAGMNIICTDKSRMNKEEVIRQLMKWGKNKCWLSHSEMQYKYAPKRIICEKYLMNDDEPGVIPDYKVYCFHGEPIAILVMHDRGHEIKAEFFDTNWIPLENTKKYETVNNPTIRPFCLENMMEAAKNLSKPFPFVRCDFYIVSGKLYFGELTFTPAGGLYLSQTRVNGKEMEEYLHIPTSKNTKFEKRGI